MFNPFYPFTTDLLNAFVHQGKTYFVRQRLDRGNGYLAEGIKGCFLFSHYDHLTTAMDHYGAIEYDPNRFLYHWANPEHQEKLRLASSGLKEYKIFASVFRTDWEKQLTDRTREQIRLYVSKLGWTPAGGEMVNTNYELQFGELYLRLKYRGREAKVKFEEIEKLP
ncbi:MAG: hypothetical protein ACJ749_18000 [Flavisolibacter sp.]